MLPRLSMMPDVRETAWLHTKAQETRVQLAALRLARAFATRGPGG